VAAGRRSADELTKPAPWRADLPPTDHLTGGQLIT
jgi:hypothetical protein